MSAASPDVKHARYADLHVPGEIFWGVGIENETYLELSGGVVVPASFLRLCQKRERYSVNYWTQYKDGAVQAALDAWMATLPEGPNTPIQLPLLMNGHSFARCDRWGEHRTLYTKSGETNPRFVGKTLLEDLEAAEPAVFGPGAQDRVWCFDGDTIEFMTQAFRNTTVEAAWDELVGAKVNWLSAVRRYFVRGHIDRFLRDRDPVWPPRNHGFAVFATNRNNVAIFNNGTFHLNLTAPTCLDKNGRIGDWSTFRAIHQRAARLFQWLSPFLVARFGSADPFANLGEKQRPIGHITTRGLEGAGCPFSFPAGSQRLAASRYVSVGTYDTRTMITGKLLTQPVYDMPAATWWQEMYKRKGARAAYNALDAIGFDINFHKFANHGLEFRIFDWIPEVYLLEVLRIFVWLFDRAMTPGAIPVPQEDPVWRFWLGECVWEGASVLMPAPVIRHFLAILGLPTCLTSFSPFFLPVNTVYDHIERKALETCAWRPGPASLHMIDRRRLPLCACPRPLDELTWDLREMSAAVKRSTMILLVHRLPLLIRSPDPVLDLPSEEPIVDMDTPLHPMHRSCFPTFCHGLVRARRWVGGCLSTAATSMRTWLSRRSSPSREPVRSPDSQRSKWPSTNHRRERQRQRVLARAVLSL